MSEVFYNLNSLLNYALYQPVKDKWFDLINVTGEISIWILSLWWAILAGLWPTSYGSRYGTRQCWNLKLDLSLNSKLFDLCPEYVQQCEAVQHQYPQDNGCWVQDHFKNRMAAIFGILLSRRILAVGITQIISVKPFHFIVQMFSFSTTPENSVGTTCVHQCFWWKFRNALLLTLMKHSQNDYVLSQLSHIVCFPDSMTM